MDLRDPGFAEFYSKQLGKATSLDHLRLALLITVGAALVLLLLFLKSPALVWLYVGGLYFATLYGARRLHRAIDVFVAASNHLHGIAKFLKAPRSRTELLDEVGTKIDSNDDSNVPEAIWSFCRGGDRSEGVRVVANSAFALPVTELAVASFLRTALILGGLFGTVLFFAIELGDRGLVGGDLSQLLPGLRGALASTLTGILGSLALGILASGIERMVEQAIWETESFIGGPVSQALASESAEAGVRDEADLWSALREEVAQLNRETTTAYGKLADDASAYAKALEAVSQQLTELPAVQVPPQLAQLGTVVEKFAHGAEVLDRTVTTLVNAVATVGLAVPKKILEDVQELRTSTTRLQEDTKTLAVIDAKLSSISSELGSLATNVESRSSSLEVTDAAADIARSLAEMRQSSATDAQSLGERVEALREAVTAIGPAIASPPSILPSQNGQNGARGEVSNESTSQVVADELRAKLESVRQDVGAVQGVLDRVASRLTRLESVYSWHERAARAPLMKLMLLPLWPSRRRGIPDAPQT